MSVSSSFFTSFTFNFFVFVFPVHFINLFFILSSLISFLLTFSFFCSAFHCLPPTYILSFFLKCFLSFFFLLFNLFFFSLFLCSIYFFIFVSFYLFIYLYTNSLFHSLFIISIVFTSLSFLPFSPVGLYMFVNCTCDHFVFTFHSCCHNFLYCL